MTQISDKRKSLVDWETAKLHAGLISNPKPIWTIFPPKKEGGRCYHFPTESNFERKVEDCLKKNPKHSLGLIVNPTIEKPADYGSRKEDLNPAGFVKTWGASNSHIKGARCLFTEGDGNLPLEKQVEVVFDAMAMPASFITFSGGKSLHFYFLLSEFIDKERFTKMQKRLQIICNEQDEDFGADKSIHSPCQVMRAVGGFHPSGKKTIFYRISQGWGEQKGILIYNPKFIEGLIFGGKIQDQKEIPPAATTTDLTKPFSQRAKNYNAAELNEGNWFTRLPLETRIPLAVEMLGFVVNRSTTGKGERFDCINILAGMKKHFGAEITAEICISAKWESDYWNPIKELPTIYEPIKSDIGCLVWQAKFGGGRKWVYENSKVINKEKKIKLENIFPPELSKNLRVITKFLPYPDYLIISTFLPAVAGALRLDTKVILNEGSDYVVPANLYVITVGKTGAKKTPLLRNLIKEPLSQIEAEISNKYKFEFAEYLQAAKNKEEKVEPPTRTMVTVGDLTEESTQKQLEIQEQKGRSLLILRDELSGFFQSMNKYTKGRGSQVESLLEYFDGGGFTSIRLDSKGSTKVRSCSKSQVSLYGNIQDKILADLIKNGDENGLWARNIFSPLPSIPVKLQVLSQLQKEEHRTAKQYLQNFLKLVYGQMYFTYELSDEAQQLFFDYEFKKQVEAQASKLASHAALLCKSAGKVGRVAGLLHIIKHIEEPVEHISKDTLLAAIEFVDFFDDFAINFQRENTKSDEELRMEKIQNICLRSKSPVAWREIQQALSPKDRKKWNKEICIESIVKLEYMGFGEITGGKKAGSIRYKPNKPYKV